MSSHAGISDAALPPSPAVPEPAPAADQSRARRNRRMGLWLAAVGVVMALMGVYILPAFYTWMCTAVGVGIAPNNTAPDAAGAVANTDQQIKVVFMARTFDNLPVQFFPEHEVQTVRVGESVHNRYFFRNLSNRTVRFRPIHNVTPLQANTMFEMQVCFCFNDQEIGPNEKTSYDVVYRFKPGIDPTLASAYVSYSLHEITADQMKPRTTGPTLADTPFGATVEHLTSPATPAAGPVPAPATPAPASPSPVSP